MANNGHMDKNGGPVFIGHETGTDGLEVPTIYEAYVREYPTKCGLAWYSISILGLICYIRRKACNNFGRVIPYGNEQRGPSIAQD